MSILLVINATLSMLIYSLDHLTFFMYISNLKKISLFLKNYSVLKEYFSLLFVKMDRIESSFFSKNVLSFKEEF
jgi:hypothetical protein